MAKRHNDALAIWMGACNPSGICHAIIEAQRAVLDLPNSGTMRVREDPAVRVMVNQLAYLCGLNFTIDDTIDNAIAECKRLGSVEDDHASQA